MARNLYSIRNLCWTCSFVNLNVASWIEIFRLTNTGFITLKFVLKSRIETLNGSLDISSDQLWTLKKILLGHNSNKYYDLAAQTTPLQWLKFLHEFLHEPSKTLTEAMERYRLFCLGAKINLEDNLLVIYHHFKTVLAEISRLGLRTPQEASESQIEVV